jgi:hypothetical protein
VKLQTLSRSSRLLYRRSLTSGNILYNRGIAFVTYESDANASFAKEAMANQSMDMDEVLNVR